MKGIKQMNVEELQKELIWEKERNIELIQEREMLHLRLDTVMNKLDEAIEENMKVSVRLLRAKAEYRKLRDKLQGIGGIENENDG